MEHPASPFQQEGAGCRERAIRVSAGRCQPAPYQLGQSAGIIEPGHFQFTASGETVARLEERLGYVHKGIEQLMVGRGLTHAARLAGRVSGDSTVGYALAFARAAEAATAAAVTQRAQALRAMAELERLANRLGDIGAVCNDAAFPLMQTLAALRGGF